jgi:hypothetical protein
VVGEGEKDRHIRFAGFKEPQRAVCQLRGVLQAAERMPLFEIR